VKILAAVKAVAVAVAVAVVAGLTSYRPSHDAAMHLNPPESG
jgi:hypothetical protein